MSRVLGGCRVLMAAVKGGARSSATNASAAVEKPPPPRRSSGIQRAHPVSPAMRKFLGVPEVSRSEAVKKIWEYIKLHQLQNPANKREIHCDEKLKTIFDGRDKVGMLEIAGLLSPHFVKTN